MASLDLHYLITLLLDISNRPVQRSLTPFLNPRLSKAPINRREYRSKRDQPYRVQLVRVNFTRVFGGRFRDHFVKRLR